MALLGLAAAVLALVVGAGCKRDRAPLPQPEVAEEAQPAEQAPQSRRPDVLAVGEEVFGLPVPAGAEPVTVERALRTFRHDASLDDLHRFFEVHLPGMEREVMERGDQVSVPGVPGAVYLYRDATMGGSSRLAYVRQVRPEDPESVVGDRSDGADDDLPDGPRRIVMPDTPAFPDDSDQALADMLSPGAAARARAQARRVEPAFTGPTDYFTSRDAWSPPGYFHPERRVLGPETPRRAHPSDFGSHSRPVYGGEQLPPSRFVPSNPGAWF